MVRTTLQGPYSVPTAAFDPCPSQTCPQSGGELPLKDTGNGEQTFPVLIESGMSQSTGWVLRSDHPPYVGGGQSTTLVTKTDPLI